jgi:DNA polymerase-3 subunit beta
MITDLVNNLPNKNIILETKQGEVFIEAENYHSSIKTLPAEEFPLIPSVEEGEVVEVGAEEFKQAIDQVVFAASTNQTQPEISGVLLSLNGKEFKMAATDRYRLAEKTISLTNKISNQQDAIVPQKTLVELSRIIGNQKGKVGIVLNDTQISLSFSDSQIISRLVDGQYPDYKQIIPGVFSTTIVTARGPLVNALRAGGVFGQINNSVKLEYKEKEQKLVLTSESQELGKNVVDLDSKVEGESGSVILNYHYILDSLQSMETENIIMKIVNDSSPSLVLPEGQEDYIYLVMPIKS